MFGRKSIIPFRFTILVILVLPKLTDYKHRTSFHYSVRRSLIESCNEGSIYELTRTHLYSLSSRCDGHEFSSLFKILVLSKLPQIVKIVGH
jgi:hypothetical protein